MLEVPGLLDGKMATFRMAALDEYKIAFVRQVMIVTIQFCAGCTRLRQGPKTGVNYRSSNKQLSDLLEPK